MAHSSDKELKRLENFLLAAETEAHDAPVKKHKVYNTDKTDLDLDQYSEAVREPKRGGRLKGLIALLALIGLAIAAYWLYTNGGWPWN